MKIKVVGKSHMEGTSKKTGKPYNFNAVFFLGHDRFTEGMKGMSVNLDPALFPYESIRIDQQYDVEFGLRGEVVAMEPVK